MTTTSVTSATASGAFTETSGNTLAVLSGGSVSAATIDGGAFLVVSSGGADYAAIVLSGGTETVDSGGTATGDQISGTLNIISTGASAVSNETVYSGGLLTISKAATVSNTTLISGGTVELLTGAATLAGVLTFSGGGNTLDVLTSASSGDGDLAVISGFSSTDRINIAALGGTPTLSFTIGGGNTSVTVNPGTHSETFIFAGTSTYTSTTLSAVSISGLEYIEYSSGGASSGGTTTSVTTSTGSGVYTVTSGNTLLVLSGGSVSAPTIDNGAFLTVSNGGADDVAVVSSGATETISSGGSATADQIAGSATVIGGATVTGEFVDSGGTLTVTNGAAVTGTTIAASGTELVLAGSASNDQIFGTLSTISGDAGVFTSETVENGGSLDLLNGNSAATTTVLSGGLFFLSGNNGAVIGTTLSGGGTLEFDSPKANISGTLTFEGGGNKLDIAVVASTGSGDLATIDGFSATDTIDVTAISATGASLSFSPNSSTDKTSVTVSGTGGSETLIFSGFAYDSFTLFVTPDSGGGAELVYNPSITTLTVGSGQTSTGITFGTGQTLIVESGGTASSTIVEGGGLEVASGIDHAASIWAGGSATVYGSASGDRISGSVTVSGAGATVTSETVAAGGSIIIDNGAAGSATAVSAGGTETVSAGSAAGDQIFGSLTAVGGAAGTLTGETVQSGGAIDLYAGNIASGTTVLTSGTLLISGAGSATNTILSGGGTIDLRTSDATLAGSLSFVAGGNTLEASAIATAGAGDLAAISGFSSTDKIDVTAISASGVTLTFATSGGNEIATISGTSGGVTVAESFVFSGTTTYNDFTLSITSDGNGGVDLIYNPAATTQTISSGTTSTGLTVGTSETLIVQSGATVSGTTVESGGTLVVSGVDVGATVSSGGIETVYGSASGDQIYGSVTVSGAGATVTDEAVGNGGTLTIGSGATDSASIILAGGTETVSADPATGDQIYGTVVVDAGGSVTSETVHGGGTLAVGNGATDSGSTILVGGSETVNGAATGDQIYGEVTLSGTGATATNETLDSAATLDVGSGTTASNTVLNGGGTLELTAPSAALAGSLLFADGGNTLLVTALAGSGDGDQAVISGFSSTDTIVVSGVGANATLSFSSSGGNEIVTVSGGSGAESFVFDDTSVYTSDTLSLVSSGDAVDLETSFAASDFNILPYDSADAGTISAGPLALYAVPVDDIVPTQMNEGFTEVDAKAAAFDLFGSMTALEGDLIGDIEPVVIGPGGQLYLLDGHHTFTALIDSIWGAQDPTVYVNVIANYSTDTETQFIAQMQANNWLLPLNDGVPETVNPNTGAPIPTSLTGLTSDVYRGLEYSILKQKDSKVFKTTSNISGADGASTPGLDKMPGLYSDFAEAAAYQDADGGLGLPYLSPGDIAIATDWNLNPDSTTTLPNVSGTVYAYQLPGFILSQNITIGQQISNATLGDSSPGAGSMEGAIDGNAAAPFGGITEINAGTTDNPIYIDTPNVGLVMQVGNDEGFSVILTNDDNTYSGGTTFLAGRLIIDSDGSLGAAPTETNAEFQASLTFDSEGFATNVTAAVQADNGIIFNSLSEGNGTLTIGTSAGEYTSSSPFVTDRVIAVGNEAATIDVNGSYVELDGPLVTLGYDNLGLGETAGFPALTIDDLSAGGGSTATAGTLVLSTPSPDFYGDIIIGNTGTPIVDVMSDATLGNTSGPEEEIGEVELNGGTLQTGASFAAPERDIDVIGGSQIDLNGNTTSWGTLTDVKRTIAIGNSSATPAVITFNNLIISQTSILQLDGSANGVTYSGAETVTFTNGINQTTASDTLVLNPSSPTALGTVEDVFSSGAAVQLVDGIAPVWIVTNEGNTKGDGPYDFVTYGADGYVEETSGVATLTGATGASVVELTSGGTFIASGDVAAYALNTLSTTISLGSNTLTLGDGTDAAGLILGSSINGGTLAFGSSQGVIWLDGSNPTISAQITGSDGLTFAGSGAATISTIASVTGQITIDSGTVTLSTGNVFTSDVAGLELGDVKSHPANSTLDVTANNAFTTLDTVGSDAAINLSNGAMLTLGDTTNNLDSTISSPITETGAAVAGALTLDGSGLFDLSGMSSSKLDLVAGSSIVVSDSAQLRVDASEFANANFSIDLNGANTQLQFALGGGDGQFANAIAGSGELNLIGGTLQLTGTDNTYTGGTVVETGSTLDITTANLPSAAPADENITDAGGLIVFDQDTAGTYSGVISDGAELGTGPLLSGSLDIDDSADTTDDASGNDVTLGAVQAYSGATDVEAGTLTLGVVNAIAASDGVTLGRVGGAVDGQTATLALAANNALTALSDNALNTTFVVLNGHVLTLAPISGGASSFGGTISDGSAPGSLVIDGSGTAELSGQNTFTGGTTLKAGTLDLGLDAAAGSGTITFAGMDVELELSQALATGSSTIFSNTLANLALGNEIDIAGLAYSAGPQVTVSGSTLIVAGGSTSESFTLSNAASTTFSIANDGNGGTLLTDVADTTVPSETVGGPYSVNENTVVALGLSVSAGPTAYDPLSTVLSVTSGTLSVVSGGGATITGNGTASVTLAGTAAEINAALSGATYQGAAGYYGSDTLSMTTTDTADNNTTSGSAAITVNSTPQPTNFFGTSTDDVLWQNTNGELDLWTMADGQHTADTVLQYPGITTGWQIVGTGDFTGNGTDDVLWENTNGELDMWTMSNGQHTGDTVLAYPGVTTGWQIVGTGDFTGNGTDDVLWQNADGAVDMWTMSNGQHTADTLLEYPGVTSGWQVAGIGDFTGNGTDDILWQNSSGELDMWTMSNGQHTSDTILTYPGSMAGWQIAGIGDFTGNGTDDILWQNSDGAVDMWTMSNGQHTADTMLSYPGGNPGWQIVGTGDFYGTGTDDILWRNTASGAVDMWTMQSGQHTADTILGSTPNSWQTA